MLRACETANVDRDELVRLCRRARWSVAALREAIEREGWFDELKRVGDELDAAGAAERHERQARAVRAQFNGGAGSFVDVDMSKLLTVVPERARKDAAEYQPSHGGRLILGPTGIGKTATAAYIGRRLVHEAVERWERRSEGYGGFFAWGRAVDLATARPQLALGVGEAPLIERMKSARVAVIDDMGWESTRDGTVAEVIADRYDTGRQTIVTSGLTFSQLTERYGEAVVRRVLESAGIKGKVISLFPANTEARPRDGR